MEKTEQMTFMREIAKKSKMKQSDASQLAAEINTRMAEKFKKAK